MKNTLRMFLLTTLLCGLVPQAFAQMPISGCTSLHEPGASYFVTTQISATQKNCITVAAENVTIDLNGFMVSGQGRGTGIISFFDGTIIKNGFVAGFTNGLVLQAALVEDVAALGNTTVGISIQEGAIHDSVAAGNGVGIVIGLGGHAHGNLVAENGATGILCAGGFCNIAENEVAQNGNGIWGSDGSTITENSVIDNNGYGIRTMGPGSVIQDNKVQANSGAGILTSGDAHMIHGNSVTRNSGVGLTAACPSIVAGNVVAMNTAGNLTTTGTGCVDTNNANVAP